MDGVLVTRAAVRLIAGAKPRRRRMTGANNPCQRAMVSTNVYARTRPPLTGRPDDESNRLQPTKT